MTYSFSRPLTVLLGVASVNPSEHLQIGDQRIHHLATTPGTQPSKARTAVASPYRLSDSFRVLSESGVSLAVGNRRIAFAINRRCIGNADRAHSF